MKLIFLKLLKLLISIILFILLMAASLYVTLLYTYPGFINYIVAIIRIHYASFGGMVVLGLAVVGFISASDYIDNSISKEVRTKGNGEV